MRLLLLAALAVPAAAVAQTTTTNCRVDSYTGAVNCTSYTPSPPRPVVEPMDYGKLLGPLPDSSGMIGAMQDYARREAARERLETASQMVAAGDCAGAQRYALGEGDLALARAIQGYCAGR